MKKKNSKLEPLTLILSIAAGVLWLFIGNILVSTLVKKLWSPLVIALYFGGLALLLIFVTWLCTVLKGFHMPETNAYPKAFLIAAGILFAAGLFQFIYSLTITPRAQDSTAYIFLIDDSGSIYDPERLRESAVKQVMASCDPDFPYAVYAFTDRCWQISDMRAAKEANTTRLNLQEGGSTNIVKAIATVVDEIKTGKLDAGDAPRILLVTDGEAGKIGLRKTLKDASEQNISICTIGMPGASNDILNKIANLTGGVNISIDNIDQLPAAMQSIATQNASFVRTLISMRESMRFDWVYSIMRILFLLCLGAGFIWIKSLLLRTNDTDANVLVPNVACVLVGALCIEVGMNIFFLPENAMRLLMCIGFTILLTKEVKRSFVEDDMNGMNFDSMPERFFDEESGFSGSGGAFSMKSDDS